jgi:hypothetical protein
MTSHKNQHYVPRFYLRRFSDDGIGLCRYLLTNKRSERRNIDNIASSFWFYGDKSPAPGFENAMSALEDQHAKIIEDILKKQHLVLRAVIPPHTSQITSEDQRFLHNYFNLLRFVLLTATRTKQAKNESEAVTNAIWKTLQAQSEEAKARGISPEAVKRLKVVRGKADVESMQLAILLGPPLMFDMSIMLLINKTNIPFITSDSPAAFVFYRFPKQRDLDPMAWQFQGLMVPSISALTGWKNILNWQAPGLMIFLPLSQKITLWLFDRRMYEPNSSAKDSVFLSKNDDVNELNRLQALNADNYLIFSKPNCSKHDVSSLHKQVESRRPDHIAKMNKLGYAKIFCESQFSFLSVNEEAYEEKAAEFQSGMPIVVRNRSLVRETLLAAIDDAKQEDAEED